MKKIFFAIFIFSAALLSSCDEYQDVTFSGIENVKIISVSQQGAEAEITAKIKNPNNVAFTIYPSDFDITLGGINAGKGRLEGRTRIKAHSEKSYTFKIKSNFSNLSLSDLPKLMSLATSKNVSVGLKGNLKGGKIFYKKTFPIDMTQSVPMSKN